MKSRFEGSDLLAGPRGRRLCYELLERGLRAGIETGAFENESALALFYATYEADPGAGSSRVLFGASDSRVPECFGSAERAAQAVEGVEVPVLSEQLMLEALITTVDRAAYWQPPDGEDMLAAHSQLRATLIRFAEALAASEAVNWWAESFDASPAPQWRIESSDRVGSLSTNSQLVVSEAPSRRILQRWGISVRASEDRAQRDRPVDPEAAWGGEWWSTPPRELVSSTRALKGYGPIGLHLVEDSSGPETATTWPLRIPPQARIATIRTSHDWAELCRLAPLSVTAEKRHDWFRVTGRSGAWVMPDWERIANHYDGVHLTVLGYLTSAGRSIDVDGELASVIAGWNPDECFWLTDVVRARDEPVRWQRIEANTHPNSDAWRQVD